MPARHKDANSILVEIGFLSRRKKLKTKLIEESENGSKISRSTNRTRIINMLAEHTKMANGTKRATGETVDIR